MVLIILLFSFLLRVPFLKKEIIADELTGILGGMDVARIGYPAIYGDQIIAHPPLAFFFHAFFFIIFGVSEQSARIVPIIFSLATSVVIYLICKHIDQHQSRRYVGLIALLNYSINPYAIQTSILIDIDQILAFFTTTLLYMFLRCEDNFKWRYIGIGSFVLFLALFTRLVTPIAFLIGVIVYYSIIRQRPRKGYIPVLIMCFLGSVIFLASWLSYCSFFNLNPLDPLIKNQGQLIKLRGINWLFWSAANLILFARWYTIPIGLLSILSIFFAFKKKRKAPYFILIAFWSLIPFITFGFFPAPFGFPKYFAPAIAPLSILLDSYLGEHIYRIKNKTELSHLLFIGSVITLIFFSLQLFLFEPSPETLTYVQFFLFPCFIAIPLLVVILLRQKVTIFEERSIRRYIAALTILAFIYASGMTGIFSISNSSTHYWIGITGTKETGLYLKAHTSNNDSLIVPKDVGYYANRTFYELFLFYRNTTATITQYEDLFIKLITEKQITYFAYAPRFHSVPLEYISIVEEVSYQRIVMGDFLIYKI